MQPTSTSTSTHSMEIHTVLFIVRPCALMYYNLYKRMRENVCVHVHVCVCAYMCTCKSKDKTSHNCTCVNACVYVCVSTNVYIIVGLIRTGVEGGY